MPTEITPEKKESRTKKLVKLLVKIVITVLCFWYISRKIDFGKAFDALQTANWAFFVLAVLAYILSKLVAAYRLNIYFQNISLHLPQWQNIKLYWLGMFYNLFLPGSISGDAYKVVVLNKRFGASYRKTSAAVLLDRFSGLLGLGVLLCIYGVIVFDNKTYDLVLVGGCLLAIAALYFTIAKFFTDFLPGFLPTFFWGLVVQAIQVGGIYLILSALHITANGKEWVFIFLFASVVSVLPLSLGGGLGTREVVFAEGATYFHIDPHVAVIISLLFYLSSVAGAAWGAYFVFHDPLQGMTPSKQSP
ncbi:lysylphosphatidylglycerol synthase transmembrane domain-containing protein [Flavisolibacter nicotianae]|uniref:lysylphosphatidylglycerol synthase transmembrane domain-containing protein n=1 Tax=Flavisolibacter nicotianae TaxID=2364882 RepID=UPI000EAC798C|nr:lysylphosphatidylglycerol synthase transmembrane domain-containing protein [Flavisolibacter nicotianae]